MAVESQQVGGLQAEVPGKSPLTVARRMPPPMWRMRAHVDTWSPATAGMTCTSREVWPYADAPNDGVEAVWFWL